MRLVHFQLHLFHFFILRLSFLFLALFFLYILQRPIRSSARCYLPQCILVVYYRFLKHREPGLSSSSLHSRPYSHLPIEWIFFLWLLQLLDYFFYFLTILQSLLGPSNQQQARRSIQISLDEIFVIFNGFRVGVNSSLEIVLLEEMIAFVLQPHWIALFYIDHHVLFRGLIILRFRIWWFFQMALSGRHVREFLLTELQLLLVLPAHLNRPKQLSLISFTSFFALFLLQIRGAEYISSS